MAEGFRKLHVEDSFSQTRAGAILAAGNDTFMDQSKRNRFTTYNFGSFFLSRSVVVVAVVAALPSRSLTVEVLRIRVPP